MIRIIDNIAEIDYHQWGLLLQTSSTKSFFQTRGCYDLYAANKSFMEPFFIVVEDEGQLKGVIIGFIKVEGGVVKRLLL